MLTQMHFHFSLFIDSNPNKSVWDNSKYYTNYREPYIRLVQLSTWFRIEQLGPCPENFLRKIMVFILCLVKIYNPYCPADLSHTGTKWEPVHGRGMRTDIWGMDNGYELEKCLECTFWAD